MADFHWKNIVRCAVRNVRLFEHPKFGGSPCWAAVAELCGVGSMSAIELCDLFGIDPHAKLPQTRVDRLAELCVKEMGDETQCSAEICVKMFGHVEEAVRECRP